MKHFFIGGLYVAAVAATLALVGYLAGSGYSDPCTRFYKRSEVQECYKHRPLNDCVRDYKVMNYCRLD